MKKLFFLLLTLILFGCEPMYLEPTYPGTYLGGGKWTLTDVDMNIMSNSSGSQIIIAENDTVCINSFREVGIKDGYAIMRQNYNETAVSRRFIKHKTQWEFTGPNELCCDWINTPGGMKSVNGLWVDYPRRYTQMEIMDQNGGTYRTVYSFSSNAYGTDASKFTLISPNFTVDLYNSNSEKSKVITFYLVLVFER